MDELTYQTCPDCGRGWMWAGTDSHYNTQHRRNDYSCYNCVPSIGKTWCWVYIDDPKSYTQPKEIDGWF